MKTNIYTKRLAFLDLDGTLIETKSGETFPVDSNDWQFRQGLLAVLKNMVEHGQLSAIAIVTNQGGIEKGFVSASEFCKKLATIVEELKRLLGPKLLACIAKYCSVNDKFCCNRKPNTGMLSNALMQIEHVLPRIELSEMLMIGDASGLPGQFSASDKQTAENFRIDYYDADTLISEHANDTTF